MKQEISFKNPNRNSGVEKYNNRMKNSLEVFIGRFKLTGKRIREPKDRSIKTIQSGASLVVQWLRLHLPMQRVWVQSLVGELNSQSKYQNIKQKQCCNKFSKDFKNDQHKKKKDYPV